MNHRPEKDLKPSNSSRWPETYGAFLHYNFLRLFIYLFLERGEERERNINVWLSPVHPLLGTWPTTQVCTRTGNWTGNPLVRSQHSIHWVMPARIIFIFKMFLKGRWLGWSFTQNSFQMVLFLKRSCQAKYIWGLLIYSSKSSHQSGTGKTKVSLGRSLLSSVKLKVVSW